MAAHARGIRREQKEMNPIAAIWHHPGTPPNRAGAGDYPVVIVGARSLSEIALPSNPPRLRATPLSADPPYP